MDDHPLSVPCEMPRCSSASPRCFTDFSSFLGDIQGHLGNDVPSTDFIKTPWLVMIVSIVSWNVASDVGNAF